MWDGMGLLAIEMDIQKAKSANVYLFIIGSYHQAAIPELTKTLLESQVKIIVHIILISTSKPDRAGTRNKLINSDQGES
jgi:hypothetical protein